MGVRGWRRVQFFAMIFNTTATERITAMFVLSACTLKQYPTYAEQTISF